MAHDLTRERATADAETDAATAAPNVPTPAPIDPGGAHAKGYSADPRPEAAVGDQDPVPLAPGPDQHPAFHVPERDKNVKPTGRSEPHDYTPNDRLMGSDR